MYCSMVVLMAADMMERDGEGQLGEDSHNLNEKIIFRRDSRRWREYLLLRKSMDIVEERLIVKMDG